MRFSWYIFAAVCAGLLLTGSGCDNPKVSAQPTKAPVSFSWAQYPVTEKMRLGMLSCRVLPKTSYSIIAPLSGPLHLYIQQAQTNLPAGFVWAEFEPRLLSNEADALAQAKSRYQKKERLFYQIDLPRQKLKMQKEIEEAERQVAMLELLSTNADIAPAALNLSGVKEQSIKPATLVRAREELQLLHESFRQVCATNDTALETDLQAQKTELQNRELDLERHQNQARFAMPFAGQLSTALPLVEGVSDYPVSAGQEIAVIRDLQTILLRVPLSEPSWTLIPAGKLCAVLNLPDGTKLQGDYAYRRVEKQQLREDIVYYFEFPAVAGKAAASLIGADVSCELWLALSQPAHVVPKLALVLQAPEFFQNRRWNEGLPLLSPGARLLVEGQTDLAVTTP